MSIIKVRDIYNELLTIHDFSKHDFAINVEGEIHVPVLVSCLQSQKENLKKILVIGNTLSFFGDVSHSEIDFATYIAIKKLLNGESVKIGNIDLSPNLLDKEHTLVVYLYGRNEPITKTVMTSKIPFKSQKEFEEFYSKTTGVYFGSSPIGVPAFGRRKEDISDSQRKNEILRKNFEWFFTAPEKIIPTFSKTLVIRGYYEE